MKRAILTICAVAGLAAVLGKASSATAQPVLERLERAIRQRVGEGTNPSGAGAEPSQRKTVTPPPAGAVRGADQGPGYLGAIADDRKDRGRGVRVLDVRADGPAAKAGLKPDDLIVSAAGVRVRQLSDLADVLALFPPGGTVGLEILRGDKQQLLKVTLGRHPGVQGPAGQLPEPIPLPPPAEQPPMTTPIPQVPGSPENPSLSPPPNVPEEPPVLSGPKLPTPSPPADHAAEQQAKIEQLQHRIEQLEIENKQLERRIEELERALTAAAKKS